jgi:[acyl-carrier-protein] S-malonyltransferase
MPDTVLVFEGQGATSVPGEPLVDLTALAPADAQRAIVVHQLGRARACTGASEASGASGVAGVVGVVGQSLGEVSALVVAGALSEEDGLRFVGLRASLPGELLPARDWTMASMTRLRLARAAAEAEGLELWVVGRNGPADCIVVGVSDDFAAFVDRIGATPTTYRELPVAAPYHTPAMAPVAAALADVVAGLDVRDPVLPVLTPTGPGEVRTAEDARRVLVDALTSPVAWSEVLGVAAERWPDARWRECGPSCSLHRFVWKNGLSLDWGEA